MSKRSEEAGTLLLWGGLIDPGMRCNLVSLYCIDEYGVEVIGEIGPQDAGPKLFVPAGAERELDPELRTLPMARHWITRNLEILRSKGYQVVGHPQFMPMEEQPEWVLRWIGHYVGEEEAAQHPFIAPADLLAGMVHEGLAPRILEILALMGVELSAPGPANR